MKRERRQERLAAEIRRIISQMILRDVKDPRISAMVSITDVEVSPDGSYATVYLSCFNEKKEGDSAEIIATMEGAKGLFRREIGKQIKLKHVPHIMFKLDKSMDYSSHIEELIRKVNKDD